LYDVMTIPRDIELPLMSRLKLLSDMNITEKRRPQDGHFTMQIKGRELNFRTATIPTHLREKMTIRFLDESRVLTGLKQLGLESDELARMERLIVKPNGLTLVTGPIGSGKTTTLYAALNQIDILHRNVMTIEDPVEYRLSGINQIQTNTSVGLTFESSLRSVLRQDADVIMVGEIRDSETARVATWAALTGQLVMGTLHTRSAVNAITMMVNLNVEPYLVASSVVGVIAQRLVRKLCPHCVQMIEPDDYLKHQFGIGDDDVLVGRAAGCSKCYQTGYIGRTGIFEIMLVDDDIRQMILSKESDAAIEEASWKKGMRTLWQNGVRKVLNGVTSPEEIFREIVL
jgi:type II secretory ATPase GspE/PulE/Tfp pilus assembly ATPase PilB-like protein